MKQVQASVDTLRIREKRVVDEETRIRKYLNTIVSDKLKEYRDILYKVYGNTSDCNQALSNMYDYFMDENGSHFGEIPKTIRDHQMSTNNKYAVFNYFDSDTLYSFMEYLTKLCRNTYDSKKVVDGYRYPRLTWASISDGINKTIRYFNNNKNKAETNYYKGYATLAKRREGYDDVLDPVTTTSSKTLAGKVFYNDMLDAVEAYFKNKHKPVVAPQANDYDEEMEQYDTMDYMYNGRRITLYIMSADNYFDINGNPNYMLVRARSSEGSLWGTYYCPDGDLKELKSIRKRIVYRGPLCNEDGDIELDRDECGEEFTPAMKSHRALVQANITTKNGTPTRKKSTPTDDDQLTLFDQ